MAINAAKLIVGTSLFSLLTACGGGSNNGDVGSGNFNSKATVMHASNTPDAAFAAKLNRCAFEPVKSNTGGNCTLGELPLLGQETNGVTPTVNQILHRSMVSHGWMKTRLEQALTSMPEDSRKLFRSVTAIIVAFDVRPAFYTTRTGAIYIDPYYLFVTQAERDTVDSGSDFRSGFDDELKYDVYFRYMLGTERAYTFFPANGQDRSAQDLTYIFSRLMFHELAHANDFLPPNIHSSLNNSHTVNDAASANQNNWTSTAAKGAYPINNTLLKRMAQVKFTSEAATNTDKNVTATDIANAIDPEATNHDYPYLTQFEDVALLTEAALMDYFYGVEYESAVLERSDQTIVWGKRKRIAKPNVKEKSRIILQKILPNVDFTAFLASRTAEEDLPMGQTWSATNSASSKTNNDSITMTIVPKDPFIH